MMGDERLNVLKMTGRCQKYIFVHCGASLTVVDDAVLQQGLSQVDSFLGFTDLAALDQPRHKLAANTKKEGGVLVANMTNLKLSP